MSIHGRTSKQRYDGFADWSLIKEAVDILRPHACKVVGNGDIVDPKVAVERIKSTDCDGIMIGRGAVRDP